MPIGGARRVESLGGPLYSYRGVFYRYVGVSLMWWRLAGCLDCDGNKLMADWLLWQLWGYLDVVWFAAQSIGERGAERTCNVCSTYWNEPTSLYSG